MPKPISARERSARAQRLLFCAVIAGGIPLSGATLSYINGDGNGTWYDGNNWWNAATQLRALPATGDDVWISRNVAATITYDAKTDPNVASLHHTDPGAFDDQQGNLTVQNEYFWGGSLEIDCVAGLPATTHTVGSVTADGILDIGNASALVHANATLNVFGTVQVGDDRGGATFTQYGSTVRIAGSAATLNIGWDGANSTYNFSPGTPSTSLTAGLIQVGNGDPAGNGGGHGIFNQSSGSVTAATLFVGFLNQGTYTLTGGTLSVGTESIGLPALGLFDQTGGNHTVNGELDIDRLGMYWASGGQLSAGQMTLRNLGSMVESSNGSVKITGISGGNDLLVSSGADYSMIDSSRLLVSGNVGVGTDGGASAGTMTQVDAGTFNDVSGTLTVGSAAAPNMSVYQLQNGTLIAQNLSLQGGNLVQTGGTATVPGTLTIAANQMYDLQAGSLTAPIASLTAAGAKIHVGPAGTAHLIALDGDGILQVDAGSHALFDTPGGLNEIDATVNNAGNVALVAGSDIAFSGTVNNNAGGIFDIQIDSGMVGGGSGTFNNSGGTLQKSGGTGTSTFSGLTLTNSSTIDGQSGTLDLNVTGTNSGAINSQAGATVKLGGTWALNAGSSFNGAGTTVAYGTLNVMGNVTAATDFQLASGGVLQGSGYTFTSTNLLELQDGSSISSPSSSTPLTTRGS